MFFKNEATVPLTHDAIGAKVVRMCDDRLSVWQPVHVILIENVCSNGDSIILQALYPDMGDVHRVASPVHYMEEVATGTVPKEFLARCLEFLSKREHCRKQKALDKLVKESSEILADIFKGFGVYAFYI